MANAFMIRRDGKEIPVVIHPYADPSNPDLTLSAAVWLASHSVSQAAVADCINYFAAYAKAQDENVLPDEIADTLEYVVSRKPYKIADKRFFDQYASLFEQLNLNVVPSEQALAKKIESDLNEEFLRVRLGGAYTSISPAASGDAYFRVSSAGFNWIEIIWNFVERNKSRITAVTIVKDPESTGIDNQYYSIDGNTAYRMPIDQFIMSSPRNVVDSWKCGPQFEKR